MKRTMARNVSLCRKRQHPPSPQRRLLIVVLLIARLWHAHRIRRRRMTEKTMSNNETSMRRQVDLGTYQVTSGTGELVGRLFVTKGAQERSTVEHWCLFPNFIRPSPNSGPITIILQYKELPPADGGAAAIEVRAQKGGTIIRALCEDLSSSSDEAVLGPP